ncbi:MAG: ferritin [Phycisphaerae bacterium]
MIKPQLAAAINKQIQHEQNNSHIYLAVALYFNTQNLHGIEAFMLKQSADERGHAEKLIKHLQDRGGKVELAALTAPKNDFANTLEAVKLVLDLERTTTALIHRLFEQAQQEKDYGLAALLQWFITEQVEEEQGAEELVNLTTQFYTHPGQMFMLDHQWGKRVKA